MAQVQQPSVNFFADTFHFSPVLYPGPKLEPLPNIFITLKTAVDQAAPFLHSCNLLCYRVFSTIFSTAEQFRAGEDTDFWFLSEIIVLRKIADLNCRF